MNRRTLLKLFGVSTLGGTFGASLTSIVSASEPADERVNWGYVGQSGPDHWGDLSPDFQVCRTGTAQSPIDIDQAITAELNPLEVYYSDIPLHILNNGHTIQVNCTPGHQLQLDEQTFNFVQFHFHHPSEHKINGQSFDMELHLVHRSEAGKLSVVGILMKKGQHNPVFQPIWDAFPTTSGAEQIVEGVTVSLEQLLPADRTYYRYHGSLTTPPCSEGVNWIVMRQPVELSQRQIQHFASLMSIDARPTQPLNDRFVLQSR